MRFLKAKVANFGSYKDLEFDFNDLGLTLVSGTTGAGKSTLQDIIPWILFGKTAKDGNVDEIRSWTVEEPTIGVLSVELQSGMVIEVTRIRGKTSQNDLYWCDPDMGPIRGKDITDTQRLLEVILGVTADLYLTAAYFNEFSQTGTFFIDKKARKRELFETLADLDLPIVLQERTANEKKDHNKKIDSLKRKIELSESRLQQLHESRDRSLGSSDRWAKNQDIRLADAAAHSSNFNHDKDKKTKEVIQKIKDNYTKFSKEVSNLKDKSQKAMEHLNRNTEECELCKQPNKEYHITQRHLDSLQVQLNQLTRWIDPSIAELETIKNSQNIHIQRYEEISKEINPFLNQITTINCDIDKFLNQDKDLQNQVDDLTSKVLTLTQLNKLSFELRAALLLRSVQDIQNQTNHYLDKYFDSEIKVEFRLENSDTLDVIIHKNGNECSYSQLSRGQRSILRLAFSVSVMKAAANRAGVHFSALFFDEVLDGLSSELKVKALGIFQELELNHETIMVIDHATEIQCHFFRRFVVTLDNDTSTIGEDI